MTPMEQLVCEPRVLDIDTPSTRPSTEKQEGAHVGYNPHKPGPPSHAYYTYWIARIRICLDVEVHIHIGNQHASKHVIPGLWEFTTHSPRHAWPQFLRGDCGYGSEENMKSDDERCLGYLFKLRQTPKVK